MLIEAFPRQRWTCFYGNREKRDGSHIEKPLERGALSPVRRELTSGDEVREKSVILGHKSATSKESVTVTSQRRAKSQSRFKIEESQSARIPDGSEASSATIAVRLCCK
jgi:hypothetical protein